jgi:FkbM family methyltransferase
MNENDILVKQKIDELNISTLHRAFNFYLNNFYCYTDCIFIDIGSNTGNFVKVLKRFDIKNNIHCFEPNNVSSITTKVAYPYIIMNNYCLGNIDGFTDILEKSFDVSSSRPVLPRLNEEFLNVECKKLDTYCELNNITKIDFTPFFI